MRSEINVTPLVDVVLVLLIIFMVVTPMLTRGVPIELPNARFHEKKQDTGDHIEVSVAYDGAVRVGAEVVPEDGLSTAFRAALEKKRADGGLRSVHLKADKRLTYGDVRKVLDELHAAGAPHVALGTDDPAAAAGGG